MLNGIEHLWHSHRALLLAFCFAVALTLFFAVRTVVFGAYWANPEHQNQPLEGWMTLRYVAYSYKLTSDEARQLLNVEALPDGGQTLRELTTIQDITLQELQQRLDQFIASHPAK